MEQNNDEINDSPVFEYRYAENRNIQEPGIYAFQGQTPCSSFNFFKVF